ncbi:MAG: glycosyl hydrolase [Verrucomicrobiales bacterium]|nr:glycosyl hydrolase [Verrucomicrobiales bacterium]
MYTETDGSRKAIGDVDVLYHNGLYHLFHLVLPNHDFIAHAVSTDGIHWRRVRNALFIGDPGSWDDLMLWTMHVSPDPHKPGSWRMFYTGLTRRDRGLYQRIGLALSDDLYHWEKYPVHWKDERGPNDPELVRQAREESRRTEATAIAAMIDEDSCFPLSPSPDFYEADLEEGRHWISFRDPYFFSGKDGNWMLAAARVKNGPTVRRGCVALLKEVKPYCFEFRPTMHHPGLYDDIEVPNLVSIDGHRYLIGSMREDAKIRYWYGDEMDAEWRSYHDNVLMAAGNYAGRICHDENGWLLWGFFAMNRHDRTADNIMPPPKRLVRSPSGLLRLKTFEQFENWKAEKVDTLCVKSLKNHEHDHCRTEEARWEVSSASAFQAFVFDQELENFWLKCRLKLQGKGKCGLVLRIDPETHDGYYLSLDLLKGVAQIRAWGTAPDEDGERMMSFETLQSSYWFVDTPGEAEISLLTFGSYIELSINGYVSLSLADRHFEKGLVGVYLETATLLVEDLELHRMKNPDQIDDHLVGG